MKADPAQFETAGSRIGFRVEAEGPEGLSLEWRGPRFPAFLCLGIAMGLLFLSIPILEAIRQRGFDGPAGSLWYFPVMNFILLGISVFLLSLKRTIVVDPKQRRIILCKCSFLRRIQLCLDYDEVTGLELDSDQVYSGFAVAGSTAAQTYPIPSLRLVLKEGKTVLIDRGGYKRLEALGERLSQYLGRPLRTAARSHPGTS